MSWNIFSNIPLPRSTHFVLLDIWLNNQCASVVDMFRSVKILGLFLWYWLRYSDLLAERVKGRYVLHGTAYFSATVVSETLCGAALLGPGKQRSHGLLRQELGQPTEGERVSWAHSAGSHALRGGSGGPLVRVPHIEMAHVGAHGLVEAQRTRKLYILPVFYKLNVEDLKDMERWKWEWQRLGALDALKCEKALTVLARINGEQFSEYGNSEVRYRKAIVASLYHLSRPYQVLLASHGGQISSASSEWPRMIALMLLFQLF